MILEISLYSCWTISTYYFILIKASSLTYCQLIYIFLLFKVEKNAAPNSVHIALVMPFDSLVVHNLR